MNRSMVLAAAFLTVFGAVAAHCTDLAAVIAKVSENCDRIRSYEADAEVRYHQ